MVGFLGESLDDYDKEACQYKVGQDCQERNRQKRSSQTISQCYEYDTGANLSSGEHSDTECKALCQTPVSVEEYREELTDV